MDNVQIGDFPALQADSVCSIPITRSNEIKASQDFRGVFYFVQLQISYK